MKINFQLDGIKYVADPSNFFDLSRSIKGDGSNLLSFGVEQPRLYPYSGEGWSLSVEQGGSCNCFNVEFIPHCHGTHTESIGHIRKDMMRISMAVKNYLLPAELISLKPDSLPNGDLVITKEQLKSARKHPACKAIIVRTLPNGLEKVSMNYSGTNPPYLEPATCAYLASEEIEHFLLDLPSVDPEEDGGRMLAHKAYWDIEKAARVNATITELIYVPDGAEDGLYALNLQVANFDLDAAPSRPLLFPVEQNV